MKSITSRAAILALTAALGVVSIAPSFAQSAPAAQGQFRQGERHQQQFNRGGGAFVGNMLDFRRGAEGIEVALVRLSHRITLSAEQQPLFDSFKTAAIAAANDFATARADLRPDTATTTTAPSMSERLDKQITLQKARLKTLETVQPSAKAFFDSLTPEQLTQLSKRSDRAMRGDRDGRRGAGDYARPGRKGDIQRPAPSSTPSPGSTPAPTAPATPG